MNTQATETAVTPDGFRSLCEGILDYAVAQGDATVRDITASGADPVHFEEYTTPAGVVIKRIGGTILTVECDFGDLGAPEGDDISIEYNHDRQLPPQINRVWSDSEGGRYSKTVRQADVPKVLADLSKFVALIF